MANGITILDQTPQANTAVLPEDHAALDAYWKGAENLYRNKELAYKQKQEQIKQAADAVNFDATGIMPSDEGAIRNETFGLIDLVNKNPDIVNPNNAEYPFFKKKYEDINYAINKSKQDNVMRSGYYKGVASGDFDGTDLPKIKDWESPTKTFEDIQNRQPLSLTPSVDFNNLEFLTHLQPQFAYELGNPQPSGIAGKMKIQNAPTPESVATALGNAWDLAPENSSLKQHFNQIYQGQDKTKYPTAKDFFIAAETPQALAMKDKEQLVDLPNSKTSGSGEEPDIASPDERYQFIKEGVTTNPANLTTFITGKPFNGGTVIKAEIVPVTPIGNTEVLKGVNIPNAAGSIPDKNLNITYRVSQNGEMRDITATIPINKANDYGVLPINNMMNEMLKGTKGQVTPESIRDKYKNDSNFGAQDLVAPKFKEQPKVLSGKIDPSQLVKGQEYEVGGKAYIWNGVKLQPK